MPRSPVTKIDYWGADEEQLEALRRAGEDLEDLLEGITGEVAA